MMLSHLQVNFTLFLIILNQIIWEYSEGKPAIDDGDVWFEAVSHCPIEIVAVPKNRGM